MFSDAQCTGTIQSIDLPQAFNIGLPDNETDADFMRVILRDLAKDDEAVYVFTFGGMNYYTQETILTKYESLSDFNLNKTGKILVAPIMCSIFGAIIYNDAIYCNEYNEYYSQTSNIAKYDFVSNKVVTRNITDAEVLQCADTSPYCPLIFMYFNRNRIIFMADEQGLWIHHISLKNVSALQKVDPGDLSVLASYNTALYNEDPDKWIEGQYFFMACGVLYSTKGWPYDQLDKHQWKDGTLNITFAYDTKIKKAKDVSIPVSNSLSPDKMNTYMQFFHYNPRESKLHGVFALKSNESDSDPIEYQVTYKVNFA